MNEVLEREREAVERVLHTLLPSADVWPRRLHRAMRYAVLGGGKRVRPVLARLAHRAAGGDPDEITEAVCGLELIHTYSLVHDDLPSLDDDVLRRGRETVHVAFDEPTAILVGDALLTEGLLTLTRYPTGSRWRALRARATELVADAVSSTGMVGGQMEDLEAGGQVFDDARDEDVLDDESRLLRIDRNKTGRLLQASVETGAVLAGVDDDDLESFSRFGGRLGLAFQVADDILDATATAEDLGKSPGKDAADHKLTWVTLFGLAATRRKLAELEDELIALAAVIEGGPGDLGDLASFVCRRRS